MNTPPPPIHQPSTADRIVADVARHWLGYVLLAWLAIAAWQLWTNWASVHWLALSDTDDNMRLMQVRGLLSGQGWYDLRQYRLNPPGGLDIHWSRLVDLPIAGLILLFKPFMGEPWAERMAVGIAPLLPLGVTMVAMAAAVRRLIAPAAWPLAIVMLVAGAATMLMFRPTRIDHHGWQLALLACTLMGLADTRRMRGGLVVGTASALSLAIGLELLPFAAMAGAIVALRWIWDAGDARRLGAYGLSLAGGTAIGFALFASQANRVWRCDALTPVWLSVMVAAGLIAFALSRLTIDRRGTRLVIGAVAGGLLAAAFAWAFPACLSRPEGVSPELQRMWLNNVREAKPIYEHPLRMALPLAVLPIIGLIGAILATVRAWGSSRFPAWAPVALFGLFACLMLLWQVRVGAAAQLLAVPGATALAWIALPWCLAHRNVLVRTLGTVVVFLGVSGLFAGLALRWLPIDPPTAYQRTVNRAGNSCPTIPALTPLNRLPATTIFTHSDLGPRLIVLTHHNGIAGPYHRNGDAILDVHHAFGGTPANFLAIARRHGATHLLVCPNLAEATVYRARNPDGFYAQLARNQVPGWLTPVPLPRRSPLRLWRIDYPQGR